MMSRSAILLFKYENYQSGCWHCDSHVPKGKKNLFASPLLNRFLFFKFESFISTLMLSSFSSFIFMSFIAVLYPSSSLHNNVSSQINFSTLLKLNYSLNLIQFFFYFSSLLFNYTLTHPKVSIPNGACAYFRQPWVPAASMDITGDPEREGLI